MAARYKLDEVHEVEEKIHIIPIRMIRPLPFNTSVIDKAIFEALQNDMTGSMEIGFERIDPILVRRLTPEEVEEEMRAGRKIFFEVVDGHKRLEAAESRGWTHIRARVINVSRDEAILINYRKNKERGEIDEIKESLFFRYLLEDKGMSVQKIAGMFSLTDEAVKTIISKAPVSREARRILLGYRSKIPPRVIEVIASAPEKIQAELAEAFASKGLSAGKLEEMKSLLMREKSPEEALKSAAEKPEAEKVLKPSPEIKKPSPAKPPVERRFPEPVRRTEFPEPVKKAFIEAPLKTSEAPQRTVEVKPQPTEAEEKPTPKAEIPEVKPPEAVQEYACPGCGKKFKVDWEKRLVEWV